MGNPLSDAEKDRIRREVEVVAPGVKIRFRFGFQGLGLDGD